MPGAGRWWTSSGGTRLPEGATLTSGKTGHSDVTRELAERFGFGSAAVAILADASQDPDFYEWGNPAAHAQTPDAVDAEGAERDALIEKAQRDYVAWIADKIERIVRETQSGRYRHALYWIGYAMHGVEDLAPHAGRTNAEHARDHKRGENPDDRLEHVELARSYAARFLRAVRGRLGSAAFDNLRSYSRHGAFSYLAKSSQELHGHGWDYTPDEYDAYTRSGDRYEGKPVRWPREVVLQQVIEAVVGPDAAKSKLAREAMRLEARAKAIAGGDAPPVPSYDGFVRVAPESARRPAKWTVMVYMAGDDDSPGGIEYAVQQDLLELKMLGSSDEVHFVAQADDATTNRGFRYRLRSDTPLDTDCMAVFNGDLNTGNVGTLVDFVRWAHRECPADNYALILWGHGAGHDDQNVYRLARGKVTPRVAAHLARKRLGFFQGSRRAILDRGPQRGFGYDDTAADFLDNHELADALATIQEVLGKRIDLLGFDACLMSMLEVAYEVRNYADMFVASARPEPGDGWYYERAFAPLVSAKGDFDAKKLACAIVSAYGEGYFDTETLAAVDLDGVERVANAMRELAEVLRDLPDEFHKARRAAINCSPVGVDGYRDLATLARALLQNGVAVPQATRVLEELERAVLARCGAGGGLTIYAPGDYRPHVGGGTDETYEGLSFPREFGWSGLLRAIYPQCDTPKLPRKSGTRAPESNANRRAGGSLYGLDRHNSHDVLGDLFDERGDRWVDHLRRRVLEGMHDEAKDVLSDIQDAARHAYRKSTTRGDDHAAARANRDRILILPGIMGSQLQDRTGTLQLVWIDPWGLTVGTDLESMRLRDDGLLDHDPGVELIATAPLPIIYDRLALALTWAFGPIVEYVPYDWRKPISHTEREVRERIEAIHNDGGRVAVVAHSMGGLVAARAYAALGDDVKKAVTGLVAMGTPWRGSFEALRALRGDSDLLRNFGALTHRTQVQLANVVQTFWGLCELVPLRTDLLQPALFAPGPLSRIPADSGPLRAASAVFRTPPPNTVAIVSDRLSTVIDATLVDGQLLPILGPGDGTVSTRSASNDGHGVNVVTVKQRHVTLPLDGAAIRETVASVRRWFGGSKRTEAPTAWELPPTLTTQPTTSREPLMQRLQLEEQITIGDLAAMLPLA